jgi:hypothetical protein
VFGALKTFAFYFKDMSTGGISYSKIQDIAYPVFITTVNESRRPILVSHLLEVDQYFSFYISKINH